LSGFVSYFGEKKTLRHWRKSKKAALTKSGVLLFVAFCCYLLLFVAVFGGCHVAAAARCGNFKTQPPMISENSIVNVQTFNRVF
jgi:hypothetical protein